jgi:TrmH family RNA methyltransferase
VVEGQQENERALQFGFENVEFFICESIFGINHPEGKNILFPHKFMKN